VLSNRKEFTLTVLETNRPPVLTVPPSQTILELVPWTAKLEARDPDLPANKLTFSLLNGPEGMTLNPTTGELSWTPAESQGPSTNLVVVEVTDDGTPPLSDRKAFTVFVQEVNSSPVLAVPPTQTIDELTPWRLTLQASDSDWPTNKLTFTLVSGPVGMTLDANTGDLMWTPSENQGPTTNVVVVQVDDNGSPAHKDLKSFLVVVKETNRSPQLLTPASQSIVELQPWHVKLEARDDDLPANKLTFSLLSGPLGMTLDATTGELNWTPLENQGPSTNVVIVEVSDDGDPPLYDRKAFTLFVQETNRPPVLTAPSTQIIDELTPWRLTLQARDDDWPTNQLTFRLLAGPEGMLLDPTTGSLTWTPGAGSGLRTNLVSVEVTDNGTPPLRDWQNFLVVVRPVLPSLVITLQPQSQVVAVGANWVLRVEATTADGPLQFKWLKNGVEIPGATTNLLRLENAQTDQSGIYQAVVSDRRGALPSTLATVTVAEPPFIIEQPLKSLTVTNGSPVRFAVLVRGATPLSYQWRKDGTDLPGQTNSSLTIPAAQPGDAGLYSVFITNWVGQLRSDSATLVVVKVEPMVLFGRVTGALDGRPLADVQLEVGGVRQRTQADGTYLFSNLPPAVLQADFDADVRAGPAPLTVHFRNLSTGDTYVLRAALEGYAAYSYAPLMLQPGSPKEWNFSMAPVLQGLRLVLNWGRNPQDLDAHLWTPPLGGQARQIYYADGFRGDTNGPLFAQLDVDQTHGFGPETISIHRLQPGWYRYFVHNFKDEQGNTGELADSLAVVQIYSQTGLVHTVTAPRQGTGDFWDVCEIDGQTGEIRIRNQLTASQPQPLAGSSVTNQPGNPEPGASPIWPGQFRWSFGDGTTSTEPEPAKTYTVPGGYEVSLSWTTTNGQVFAQTRAGFIQVSSALPRLQIRRAGASAVVSWPASAAGWHLEYQTNLFLPAWLPAPWNTTIDSGTNQAVTVPLDDRRYFRLRKP
jgi:PKD repeat protein